LGFACDVVIAMTYDDHDDEAEREYRRAEIDKGWATVARTSDVQVERRSDDDDPLVKWKRGMERSQAKPSPSPSQRSALTDAELQALIDSRIALSLAEYDKAHQLRRDALRDAVAEFVAGVRKQLRAEIAAEVGLLRADVEIAKAHDSNAAEVIDLPPFIRKRSDAA
jgi:hypothetical protein